MFKNIVIVADHRGEDFKHIVASELSKLNINCQMPNYDTGADNDYPDVVKKAYQFYLDGTADGFILLCGTGVGMCIGANKCKGIRCVWANSEAVAAFGRIHEDCNALALGVNYSDGKMKVKLKESEIRKIVKSFVTTQFAGGRHLRRVEKLNLL